MHRDNRIRSKSTRLRPIYRRQIFKKTESRAPACEWMPQVFPRIINPKQPFRQLVNPAKIAVTIAFYFIMLERFRQVAKRQPVGGFFIIIHVSKVYAPGKIDSFKKRLPRAARIILNSFVRPRLRFEHGKPLMQPQKHIVKRVRLRPSAVRGLRPL